MKGGLSYHFFIVKRYIKSRKKSGWLSFTTAISLGGVTLGVMTLLLVLSVMSGFHDDLQKKILGVSSHVVVLHYSSYFTDYLELADTLQEKKHVVSASPFVLGQVMIAKGERARGVVLRGIIPERETLTTEIDQHMTFEGSSLSELDRPEGTPGIVLGSELASSLRAYPGDVVRIISPVGEMGPLGMIPDVEEFEVTGVFEMGMYEYDANLAIVALKPAQEFFKMDDYVTGIELRVDDIYKASPVAKKIKEDLGYLFYTKDWTEMNRNLFSALKLEKLAMFVILVLIVLVAAFNIVSTLTMNVVEKEREIAILKAMGASNRGIMTIFILQGFIVGLAGTILGIIGGFVAGYVVNEYELIKLPADIYYLSHLPVKMRLSDFIAVSVSAVLISFVATIYPAWKAAKLDPVEPLRYE